ncbi:MAG: MobF family relaxase [Bryobacteraceae bacterium]
MLKISKPLGVQKVSEYYKFEYGSPDQAYYTEGKQLVGEWHGRLAAEFGLVGAVDEEHYNRLATGQHPWSGEQLIKHRPPSEDGPAWLRDDRAWREHLEMLFGDAVRDGRDCFRSVTTREEPGRTRLKSRLSNQENRVVPPTSKREAALLEMHRVAAQTFQENLNGEMGAEGRSYLESRSVTRQTANEFGLGVSSRSGGQLVEKLEHFGPELMEASGLFVRGRDGRFQDRFRGRLMFPIQNDWSEVIAFAGRELNAENGPKYLNSPTTEIYKKSAVLYNLNRALIETPKSGRLVLVEGYMDVLAAHSAGVRDVVAACGTALSEDQAALMKNCADEVLLNLDPDQAGRDATLKQSRMLLQHGIRVKALDLLSDPAEYVQQNGAAAYRKEVRDAHPFIEWLAVDARVRFNVNDIYGRIDALHSIIDTLERVVPENRQGVADELTAYLQTPAANTPQEKTKKHAEHVAAWDWTLAPHKSYSVTALVGGDRGLIDDHKKAVRVALDAGEKYTQARLRDVAPMTSPNWCAALFLHDSARPVGDAPPNPHLHTHAVVFNMTNAGDKVRSIQSREWFRIQSYVTAVYQAEMACAARARGYELEHGRNYSTALKGYTEEYLKAVSARTEEIEREKAAKGLVGAEADERVNKRLRQAKREWQPEALWKEYRAQAERYGNNPEGLVRAARERPALVFSEKERELRADRAIEFAKRRLLEANAVVDHYELMRDALRYGLGHLRLQDVERAFEVRRAQSEREFIQVGHYRTNAPGERFTTSEMRKLELDTMSLA